MKDPNLLKPVNLFVELLNSERTSGILLLVCTAISLWLTNSSASHDYLAFWHQEFANGSVEYWINDGLMAIFFLMIGLELEREIFIGELSDRKKAMLPVIAALGGMLVPAGIHMLFNHGTAYGAGAGIPMATDIAFAVGILALLGDRVPMPLKVFLMALAVIDDLGAIFTIAIFYSTGIHWGYLGGAFGVYAVLLLLNRLRVYNLTPYLVLGAVMWWLMLHSGVHSTVAGVLVAFAIPFGDGTEQSTSWKLQHFLHKPVTFIILPLFALANTCLVLEPDWYGHLVTSNGWGIFLGLVAGKPIGIGLACALAVGTGMCVLPTGISWKKLLGVGALAGIGFTMSIFITLLAFKDPEIIVESKTTILVASLTAGILGFIWLRIVLPKPAPIQVQEVSDLP
ncbi:MAG: Na+/H+ antiporter NhaA [Flavobacteriales bacterium]